MPIKNWDAKMDPWDLLLAVEMAHALALAEMSRQPKLPADLRAVMLKIVDDGNRTTEIVNVMRGTDAAARPR